MPRYSKEFILEIKSKLSVSEVIGKFVKLTQRGNEYVGLSPFKNEKTPSFTVNDEKEFYHCFSSAEHGDIFSFLMKHKNMTYPESIEYLAKQAGMDPETGIIRNANYIEKDFSAFKSLMNEANNYFKLQLNQNISVKNYLDKRLLNEQTIKKYELGYSGNGSSNLFNHLKSKGYKIEDAISLGLIKKSNKKKDAYYDFFRNRLMFPIKDFKSNIIAFGGRDLENSNIKYINSSDSPIFKKSYQLFGLDIAIEENRKIKDLIIVEGYMDVVALYQNNFKNTVAPLGTALTSTQLERAWKVCENPIIMFDGDEAGQKASYRAAILALSYLLPDLSLRFCILPKDYDPDDFMQNWGANDMKITIEKSLSLSEFIWEQELKKEDISTPEKKAGFEKRIFDITKKINNQTVRDYYIKFFKEKLSKKYHSNQSSYISLNRINNKISKEVILSDRANYETHDSVVREKIIILSLLENPFLASKHIEELGKIPFNDLKLSSLIANILEIFASRVDKELENFNLKSYLLDKGLAQEIDYIYQPKLLDTYSSIINNDEDSVEKGFQGLLQLHKNLIEGNDLKVALTDLEEKMDEQSFENFMKIKKESLNNN
tara:strand:- start:71 stop:1873 length:1803 start_codon:yes stop_codon:yes gene_type:complete